MKRLYSCEVENLMHPSQPLHIHIIYYNVEDQATSSRASGFSLKVPKAYVSTPNIKFTILKYVML